VPKFAYVAVSPDGTSARGVQVAPSLQDARAAITGGDLRIVDIAAKRRLREIEVAPARIRPAELMHLSRQLGAFLRAGIPILDAISVLAAESDRTAVRRALTAMGEDLRAGQRLSDSLDRHPRDFPTWYRGILRSAELTGRLDEVLDQVSGYLERDIEARKKIKSAMIYPAIVFVMAMGTVAVLSLVVLPKFETFFASLDADLPWPTRALLASTRFMGTWWWLVGGIAGVLVLACAVGVRTGPGRMLWHRLLLRLPVIGEAVRYAKIERFTRLLASMVKAGVPLPEAMTVATGSLNNRVFERGLEQARAAMLSGEGLAGPVAATGLFPGVAAQMMRVGEDTGTLDTQLEVAARFYERELDYKIQKVTAIIEPVVIVVMGGIVAFVAVALVSAMYDIFRTAHLR
jgi:type IV pilus assembly protein PilC